MLQGLFRNQASGKFLDCLNSTRTSFVECHPVQELAYLISVNRDQNRAGLR
jgi:hypothetical protein